MIQHCAGVPHPGEPRSSHPGHHAHLSCTLFAKNNINGITKGRNTTNVFNYRVTVNQTHALISKQITSFVFTYLRQNVINWPQTETSQCICLISCPNSSSSAIFHNVELHVGYTGYANEEYQFQTKYWYNYRYHRCICYDHNENKSIWINR